MPKLVAGLVLTDEGAIVPADGGKSLSTARALASSPSSEDPWYEVDWSDKSDKFFTAIGLRVTASPWTTIAVVFTFALVCMGGLFSPNTVYENRSERLWVPVVSLFWFVPLQERYCVTVASA
jgi:hypothetical protein